MYLTVLGQNRQGVSCILCRSLVVTLKGNDRRQSVQVSTTKGMPCESRPLRGIHTGADSLFVVHRVRRGSLDQVRHNAQQCFWSAVSLGVEGIRNHATGHRLFERYAPLMAITEICGNRRRTTERNSKPDICGIFRSESTMAGSLRFNCNRASNPLIAVVVCNPPIATTAPDCHE